MARIEQFVGKHHALILHVRHDTDVAMNPATRHLIDRDRRHIVKILALPRTSNVVVKYALQTRVTFPHLSRDGSDRHLRLHAHDQGFEEQCETTARPRPRDMDMQDATSFANKSGNAGMEVADMLEEVNMMPLFLDRVMLRKVRSSTDRTDEQAVHREVQQKIETRLISREFTVLAEPGWCQSKSIGEERFGRRKYGLIRAVKDARNLRKSGHSRYAIHAKQRGASAVLDSAVVRQYYYITQYAI